MQHMLELTKVSGRKLILNLHEVDVQLIEVSDETDNTVIYLTNGERREVLEEFDEIRDLLEDFYNEDDQDYDDEEVPAEGQVD